MGSYTELLVSAVIVAILTLGAVTSYKTLSTKIDKVHEDVIEEVYSILQDMDGANFYEEVDTYLEDKEG